MEDHSGFDEQRLECAKQFDRLESQQEHASHVQAEQGRTLVKIETNVLHLSDSVRGLTAALWGIVIAAAGLGIMFFVDFVKAGGFDR